MSRHRLRNAVAPPALAVATRWLLSTLRPHVLGEPHWDAARGAGRPPLYAFFHGRQLYFLTLLAQSGPITALTSRSTDGELLARVLGRLGVECVRGSSSKSGGAGLVSLLHAVEHGRAAALAVDGPRGPYGVVKLGIVALARQLGAPIVPVAGGAPRKQRLRSWDRFEVPAPFGRVNVAFGAPISVSPEASREEMEEVRAQVERRLWALAFRVDEDLP